MLHDVRFLAPLAWTWASHVFQFQSYSVDIQLRHLHLPGYWELQGEIVLRREGRDLGVLFLQAEDEAEEYLKVGAGLRAVHEELEGDLVELEGVRI